MLSFTDEMSHKYDFLVSDAHKKIDQCVHMWAVFKDMCI